jgi:predicted metal-dependent peptidase|tara:strand:- start:1257 stop:2435 length:1179 start_codon:yes stop_codon:yes gene_type:complete
MSEEKKPEFDLNKHTARLLMNEPFFAGLSRRIDKQKTTSIPTAGVTVDKKSAQFVLMYNPSFFEKLSDKEKLGVLKHEFYHLVFEHVTGRKPEGGLTKTDNMCMDLAINSHLIGELPDNCCIPGVKPFEWAPPGKSYEWYKKNWQGMDEQEGGEGGEGEGEGNPSDSFDDHSGWDQVDNTENEIAKERLKEAIKKAAEEASQAGSWGSVPADCRKDILDRLKVRVNWEKALRYFVKTSQKAEKRSTVRRINKRFPYIHPGKKIKRTAKFAVSIDQSGSVDDEMLAKFFSALDKLAKLASFTVVPFDTEVCEEHVFEWKKGKRYKAERVRYGGTCFDAPTKWVNERSFDGHIVLTDMMAPKPVTSKCKRLWVTTAQYAERPYFETKELVLVVD